MKFTKLNRTVHNWLSIFVALPLLLVIVSGMFLLLKKDVQWIQPLSVRGVSAQIPQISHSDMLRAVNSVEQTAGLKWTDFDRIDYKVDKGMLKFITHDQWEVQVDTTTGEILSSKARRSDFFEKLHDGTYFGDWMKYYVLIPSAIFLFTLWMSGLYMFIYPYFKRAANKRNKKLKAQKHN